MVAKLRERTAPRQPESGYQFPLWPEAKRGVPNHFLRSALFTARQGIDATDTLSKEVIFSQENIEIRYTGLRLSQFHLSVYEGVMHLARQQDERSEIEFTAYGLLRTIGRKTGGKDAKRLLDALDDLTATSVQVKDKKTGNLYWGSLLPDGDYSEETGRFVVTINSRLIRLFKSGFTLLEQKERRALARSPLASFLQGWVTSHVKPHPVSVAYLNKLSGSNTKRVRDFKVKLKTALNRLEVEGVVKSWSIDKDDLVTISKGDKL